MGVEQAMSEQPKLGAGKKVIFFDLNGTLLRKRKSASQMFSEALHHYTARWVHEDKAALINRASKIYAHALRQYKRKQTTPISDKQRRAAIKRAIIGLPLPVDEDTIISIEQELLAVMNSDARIDHLTIAVLNQLKRRYRLALITNGRERAVLTTVRRHDLDDFFTDRSVIVSSSLGRGRGKPHPAIFRHALNRMRVRPEQAIMVGDSWRHDIEGATHIGIDAIWVNPSGKIQSKQQRNSKVRSIREIGELTDLL